MRVICFMSIRLLALAAILILSAGLTTASADAPCPPDGNFGECKVLVEINASDGDIGFHFLMDGDDLRRAALFNPDRQKIFSYRTRRELKDQYLTETFAESAEPLCFDPLTDEDTENDDEDFVTLEDFIERWKEGYYYFVGVSDGWELSFGKTMLTFDLPAAPNLDEDDGFGFDDEDGVISWEAGDDLGECSAGMELLATHPEDVPVASWEVVLEPDVEDDDARKSLKYTVRVPPGQNEVTVPEDYLDSLGPDTPVKIEVGAIGFDDNATFTEEDGICVNEVGGCEE